MECLRSCEINMYSNSLRIASNLEGNTCYKREYGQQPQILLPFMSLSRIVPVSTA